MYSVRAFETQQYPIGIFNDLYNEGWPIEDDFKAAKRRMDLENFSGNSVQSIHQDYHAKVFVYNLVAVTTFPIKDLLGYLSDAKMYRYQID